MAYNITFTKNFSKDVERCRKRGYNMTKLRDVLDILIETGSVPSQYRPHKLSGNRDGEWECHISPDWLLVWKQNDQELTLLMLNTGTHSDLF
ncbi:MAG: type II toxin-antitoxin system YafQ family toxin [Prevotellaceae bacterium]|nr:type II toxin-antitoxin system YafQ family toxin [Candidatus Colivivens equi]